MTSMYPRTHVAVDEARPRERGIERGDQLRHIIDGERVVTVSVGSYFAEGIETEEQLEAALNGIREECARLIGAGKKVIVQ